MSKKVLIISGSPRKGGNSDLLCDEFMRGAVEAGNKGFSGIRVSAPEYDLDSEISSVGTYQQILIEADYIANASENGYSRENVMNFMNKIMKTESGKNLVKAVFVL